MSRWMLISVALLGCAPETAAPRPQILAFRVSSAVVQPGAKVSLSWSVRDASSVSVRSVPGPVLIENGGAEGTVDSASLDANTEFVLVARNATGEIEARLAVEIRAGAPLIGSFEARPNPAARGSTGVLSWRTELANRVLIKRDGSPILDSTTQTLTGTLAVVLDAASIRFELEAINARGTTRATLEVTTLEPPRIVRFEVSPRVLDGSGRVAIDWETANAAEVRLTANGAAVASFPGTPRGNLALMIDAATRFELSASSAAGTAMQTVSVTEEVRESEPNDGLASANMVRPGLISAALDRADDRDAFRFFVPAGSNVALRTGDGAGGCAVDTRLALYDPQGVVLGEDDDDGPATSGSGRCARIEPRLDDFAIDLPEGDYVALVSGSGGIGPTPSSSSSPPAAAGTR